VPQSIKNASTPPIIEFISMKVIDRDPIVGWRCIVIKKAVIIEKSKTRK
jgi:hypothetical protein